MKIKGTVNLPEKTYYTKYYEYDGALRAYANRMMWFGISAVLISFVLALLLFYGLNEFCWNAEDACVMFGPTELDFDQFRRRPRRACTFGRRGFQT